MTWYPSRDDYLSRRDATTRIAAVTPREKAALTFEDRGRAAIRASSRYLADPSTSLEDAQAAIKLLRLALSDVIMVAEEAVRERSGRLLPDRGPRSESP
ncbi:hypothetical protein M271_08075 [Streptomyces rapamycinicus NRRL 5491]|uniref:Uncharacterized protein n=1 Tax=Streptomyces rapamycinicus (strain ATCC 29253 / DSM 41530 / NRRL 5491 / AYB-994) TaxID=1343740 RepID=A0A0A0NFN5_STRRN|nr:hypothetical protein M271_08075 [Streptomyces rapamycinicus NRRL 5491]RLV74629.1 hypothetical protein D3C57_135425 [Streptomyces rapamycinicus NRRL 5491]